MAPDMGVNVFTKGGIAILPTVAVMRFSLVVGATALDAGIDAGTPETDALGEEPLAANEGTVEVTTELRKQATQ